MKSSPSDLPPFELTEALEAVRPRLGTLATPLVYFLSIGSTNDVAASMGEGAVVIADQQTSGRGRRGHTWFSPPGSGLYVSVVLVPGRAVAEPSRATMLLTLTAGVALGEAVERATGLAIDLKWPNDLFVGRRKIGGILAEAHAADDASNPRVVIGYGINVNASAFPPELADRATSLEGELGRPVDRFAVLAETLASLSSRYDDLLAARFDAILDAWRARAPRSRGARIQWHHGTEVRTGETIGIDDWGALLVRAGDRIERIVSGEIAWL